MKRGYRRRVLFGLGFWGLGIGFAALVAWLPSSVEATVFEPGQVLRPEAAIPVPGTWSMTPARHASLNSNPVTFQVVRVHATPSELIEAYRHSFQADLDVDRLGLRSLLARVPASQSRHAQAVSEGLGLAGQHLYFASADQRQGFFASVGGSTGTQGVQAIWGGLARFVQDETLDGFGRAVAAVALADAEGGTSTLIHVVPDKGFRPIEALPGGDGADQSPDPPWLHRPDSVKHVMSLQEKSSVAQFSIDMYGSVSSHTVVIRQMAAQGATPLGEGQDAWIGQMRRPEGEGMLVVLPTRGRYSSLLVAISHPEIVIPSP